MLVFLPTSQRRAVGGQISPLSVEIEDRELYLAIEFLVFLYIKPKLLEGCLISSIISLKSDDFQFDLIGAILYKL